MTYRIEDRWLWLGTGVALFIAVKGISYAIRDIVRLTAIQSLKDESEDERQKQPEDCTYSFLSSSPVSQLTNLPAISLDVLQTLASSPNPDIGKSAIDLITARCLKTDGFYQSVQVDAASSDPILRSKARTALSFLRNWSSAESMGPLSPHHGMGRHGVSVGNPGLSPSVLSNDYEFDLGAAPESEWIRAANDHGFIPSEDDPVAGWAAVPRERDGSVDAELRRRRREAMVLHEGVGGLGEEDIIRPRMR